MIKKVTVKRVLANLNLHSIRAKTRISLVLMFLGLILAIYFILSSVMLTSIDSLEQRLVAEHIKRAENVIKQRISSLSQVAIDWGVWDETYKFVESRDNEYIKVNKPEDALSNLHLNAMIFINSEGEIVYAIGKNLDSGEIMPISPDLILSLQNSAIMKNDNPDYKAKQLIMLSEGPMLIASCPILSSDAKGPVRGNLVVARYLDSSEIGLLSKTLNLELSLHNLDQNNIEKDQQYKLEPESEPVFIDEIDNNFISGYSVLKDSDGQPVLLLGVKMDREISKIGRQGTLWVLYALIAASMIFAAIMLVFLENNILSRLLKMSKDIKLIGRNRTFAMRLNTETKRDELTDVAEEINSMLDELEVYQARLIENEKALKMANENLWLEIKERQTIQEKIKYLAYHDYLTDLPNRILFNELIEHAIHISKRAEKMFTILFLDLDGFKMINDTLGHSAGDKLLVEVSKRLTNVLRESDIVARVGGDEFIILIEDIKNVEHINKAIDKIRKCFTNPFLINGHDFFIDASIGVSIYPDDGEDGESLVKNADIAMYKAKEQGKGQCVFCTHAIKNKVVETVILTNELYGALERNEFELYYQPQIDCTSSKVKGVEALIRWNHPVRGLIYPDQFIPIAEQTGLIIPIGEWVTRNACRQNKFWQDAGLPKIIMGVNLSVVQLQNTNIVSQIKNILRETGLESYCLELEITENIAMKEKSQIIENMTALKNIGINIAIDDFGTEYSSLSYLKHLPIDRIKIAMPFIQGIDVNDKDKAITTTIIVLAKSMGINVIAEGVESSKQLDFLHKRMCDEVQGFYHYKPMPAGEMAKLLRKQVVAKQNCV